VLARLREVRQAMGAAASTSPAAVSSTRSRQLLDMVRRTR